MKLEVAGVEEKLARALSHIQGLETGLRLFTDKKPFGVQVHEELHEGRPVGRFVAVRNFEVPPLDTSMVLLAGEALYQLRSALDHLVHGIVRANGRADLLERSRKHQFPIFEDPLRYVKDAPGMINGVPDPVSESIEACQPFKQFPGAARIDPLWVLQHLNNIDKHRTIPVSVVGIGGIRCLDKRGTLFTLDSEDVVLEHHKVFWSFTLEDGGSYEDLTPQMTCVVSFAEVINLGGYTLGMDHVLRRVHERVWGIIERLKRQVSSL